MGTSSKLSARAMAWLPAAFHRNSTAMARVQGTSGSKSPKCSMMSCSAAHWTAWK